MNKTAVFLSAQLCLVLSLNAAPARAYGGGGGGSASCAEAKFYDEIPARGSKIASLEEIAVVASDNTDLATLDMQVNGKPLAPAAARRRSGEWELKARLPEPLSQPGKVRVTLTAKSKEGCETFFPYYLQIGQ